MASERWRILRKAVLRNESGLAEATSNLSLFASFDLFKVSDSSTLSARWLNYSCVLDGQPICDASVKLLQPNVSLETLAGFNNTGNVCVWPSEEVMAYNCLENREMFKEASVCELGCGMSGLAGLLLACANVPSTVVLTDGNETSVANVREILDANMSRFDKFTSVSCEVLQWENLSLKENYLAKFDYVLCADCLFFSNVHHELAQVIKSLLKPCNGMAILFAPRRSGTLEQFCLIAKDYFNVECIERHSEKAWEVLQDKPSHINVDLHYPLKIVLTQK